MTTTKKFLVLVTPAALAVVLGWFVVLYLELAKEPKPSEIDIGFTRAMAVHHQQAISMAHIMLDGRPTQLAQFATQVSRAQMYELGQMMGWLKLWREPVTLLPEPMSWMLLGKREPDEALLQYLIDCEQSPNGMSGLASQAEMLELAKLEGDDRDQLFLELMLRHHQGGLPMASFAADEGSLMPVRRLASSIVLEQSKENIMIERMLAVLKSQQ